MYPLSPEQRELQLRARELAQRAFAPTAAETDRTEEYPWANVALLRDAGFMGMTLPTSVGGQGRSYHDAVIVIEEMAKACATMGERRPRSAHEQWPQRSLRDLEPDLDLVLGAAPHR